MVTHVKSHRLVAILGELRKNENHKLCRRGWSEWRSELTELRKGQSGVAKWQHPKLSRDYY